MKSFHRHLVGEIGYLRHGRGREWYVCNVLLYHAMSMLLFICFDRTKPRSLSWFVRDHCDLDDLWLSHAPTALKSHISKQPSQPRCNSASQEIACLKQEVAQAREDSFFHICSLSNALSPCVSCWSRALHGISSLKEDTRDIQRSIGNNQHESAMDNWLKKCHGELTQWVQWVGRFDE